ncbi:putative GTP diphosphokinase, Guanosine-3',5'-bis(diphosphate) 3'-diphosphatase [Helianthus debilis subsp. tardiflorus]
MYSCETSRMLLGCRSSLVLVRNSKKIHHIRCCMLDQIAVYSPLTTILTSGNVIAAAAAGSGSLHGAVTSAITQVAVTAVAIASGACLSTKVDCLWPKVDEQPGSLILDGVDVTGYPVFNDPKVHKAIGFARNAHRGQLRKTGDPYITHCINTAKILAVLVPSTGKKAIDTVISGILHDVVDDTCESLHTIETEFGEDIAKLVAGVSRLSYINQLLRRHRRINVKDQATLGYEEANNLRVMLLGMVDDPRVVLIKLADRLHNMRTIYALPSAKAKAVAQETLVVWCSLASRLGLWALKAELEDLCFAVLQPQIFRQMRSDLASMWTPSSSSSSSRVGNHRRLYAKSSEPNLTPEREASIDDGVVSIKDLLQAVVPFDLLLDRRKRIQYIQDLGSCTEVQTKPKVVRDAGIALASLVVCEEELERELFISTSYVPGMEVTLSSRLKSLYSIYSKMNRKDVSIDKVYDARALRVIVGDKSGTLHGQAVRCCYSLLNIIHRLWTPIDGEFDDYIVNPKPSGYQSLHTAVHGPENSPMEVQIRTQSMHEYAEHGVAAHWLYKEAGNNKSSVIGSEITSSSYLSNDMEDKSSHIFQKYSSLKVGHPVLRVEGSHLLAAVIVRVDGDGRHMLVASSFVLSASEAVADRRSSSQRKRWEAYARLYKKVSDEWWCEPGHGDWCTCLEKYTLCRDGIYHKQDQFQRLLPTFIQVIDLSEAEEIEYWNVVSAVSEGKQLDSVLNSSSSSSSSSGRTNFTPMEAGINNKVLLLRTMLQWEEQLRSEAGFQQSKFANNVSQFGEIAVVCWPDGEIVRLRSGSTAADAATRVGLEGKLVSVNGQIVLPNTQLKDGDVIQVRVR